MAHFYGTLQGTRGEATRCGTKRSGLVTHAASWDGAVKVTLSEREGRDFAFVELTTWQGHGTARVLFDGPVDGSEQA